MCYLILIINSKLQMHVSECLGRLGVPHEYKAKVGGFSVDMKLARVRVSCNFKA